MQLTKLSFKRGLQSLIEKDTDLARILKRLGQPPMWEREPGFSTLVHIILEQQVSLASAKAAFQRLNSVIHLTPDRFLKLSDAELKTVGFSRQKTGYCRDLAESIVEGRIDLDALKKMSESAVKAKLLKIKGIGPWTADIYLLMVLLRPDIWPVGDLALAQAVFDVKNLSSIPSTSEMDKIGADWKPWRAIAARLLWFHYLNPIK